MIFYLYVALENNNQVSSAVIFAQIDLLGVDLFHVFLNL